MAYTSPTISASGATWADLKAGGLSGHLEKIIAANTLSAEATSYVRLVRERQIQRLFDRLQSQLDAFLGGDPVSPPDGSGNLVDLDGRLADFAAALKAFATAVDEIAALVDANPGTIGTAKNPAGEIVTRRTWS